MRARAVVVLAAMPLLLGAWTLSDNGVAPNWRPEGKAVVKTPDGVSLVIRKAWCSFGRYGGIRLRFGGKPVSKDMLYMQLVAQRREGNPNILDIFDGAINLGPKWADAPNRGTAHVQIGHRRGTFVLRQPGSREYTGTWNCGAATALTRSSTRVTIVAPRLAQPGETVRVAGRVIGGSSIVAKAVFRVSGAGSTKRKIIRIHESRFKTWTRFSKSGAYRVYISYPGDTSHLPSRAWVKIRVA
jgi:hypothetical protein